MYAQNTRPVPDSIFPYEFVQYGPLPDGYILATPFKMFIPASAPNFISPGPVIYDKNGYLAWYARPDANNVLDFKYIPALEKYVYTYVKQGVLGAHVLDNQFNSIDTLTTVDQRDVHDLQLSDNGNWLLATAYFDTMDLSAYTFDGTQGNVATVVKGYGYEEMTQAGAFVQSWNSNNFIHPTETLDYWGYNANNFDYCHGNAIEEDTDGNLILSYRHLNSIHKIDRQTGAVIWRLGGELSDFTFIGDNGFSGQHDMRRLPNGDLSLFDNGNETGITRGITYSLDTVNWTATLTSEFIHPTGATSTAMGSYQVLTTGEQLLGYGRIMRPEPSATLADASGNVLGEFYLADSVVSYRFLHFDLNLPVRPQLFCNEINGTLVLEVEGSHNNILWSTGETTQSIVISQSGTYQAWVDQGIGMLGSEPFVFDAFNPNNCSVGIDEIPQPEGAFTLFDVLGKEINYPQSNTLYLKVYENGSIQKVVFE